MPSSQPPAPGGAFLFCATAPARLFTPEEFSSEQRQIATTTASFVVSEICPAMEQMEQQDFPLVMEKLRRCAELGLFLIDIPEEYGGLELDKVTSMLVAEKLGPTGSFAITSSGQSGIGTLPLVYYGTPDQKARYLDKLTSGAWIAAYCLTEPDSGSDPLSARTSATLSADGSCYLLNGIKQFITNAAFADLFTVFAKIDGQQFSAFLVERSMAGLSVGREEQKMGLKGTSTAQVVLENVRVPVANLLGAAGKGHKIAFNVLNIGRLKLAATVTGAAKGAFAEAAKYAAERMQFGQPLADFGAIREKLADLCSTIFAAESLLYRVAGLLDARLAALERTRTDYAICYQQAIEEYAVECACAKVFCSDSLALVADEALQIHGGYGYMKDYPVERYYRDERINRIFEGTNEINRLLIPTLLLRRADSGALDLWAEVEAARRAESDVGVASESTMFAAEYALLSGQKQLLLRLFGALQARREEQELLLALGDMCICLLAFESSLLRADKSMTDASPHKRTLLQAVARVTAFEVAARFQQAARRAVAYGIAGEELALMQKLLARLGGWPVSGLLEARRLLAAAARDAGGYPF